MKKNLIKLSFLIVVAGLASVVYAQTATVKVGLGGQDDLGKWYALEGGAAIGDGVLELDGREYHCGAFLKEPGFSDVELSVGYQVKESQGVMAVGLVIGATSEESFTAVHLDRRSAILYQSTADNNWIEIKRVAKPHVADTWYSAALSVKDGRVTLNWNGSVLLEAECKVEVGRVGVYARQASGVFKDIVVKGERVADLAPWKIVERIHGAPRQQARAEIIWTKAICKQPGRYIGWATACLRKNGELLAAFSGDRDEHVCPFGKVQMIRSGDFGESWSEVETICNTQLDDRDAGIIELPNGDLLVTWFTSVAYMGLIRDRSKLKPGSPMFYWWLHDEKLPMEVKQEWLGYFTARSTDGGKSWEPPVRTAASANHGPIVLKDGRLLMVGRTWLGDGTSAVWQKQEHRVLVEESRDNGRSWQVIAELKPTPPDKIGQFHEPHVVECDDGRLVAQFRFHANPAPGERHRDERECKLRQAESSDGGKTWTPMVPTELQGYPPHLIKLRSGKLLTVYGRRFGPGFGEYACLSDDEGRTWDVANEIKLAGNFNGDLGYPASVELPDGTILTVYYQPEKQGEKTCLMATKWRVLK